MRYSAVRITDSIGQSLVIEVWTANTRENIQVWKDKQARSLGKWRIRDAGLITRWGGDCTFLNAGLGGSEMNLALGEFGHVFDDGDHNVSYDLKLNLYRDYYYFTEYHKIGTGEIAANICLKYKPGIVRWEYLSVAENLADVVRRTAATKQGRYPYAAMF